MTTIKDKMEMIDRAIRLLTTGETIYNGGTKMRPSTVINRTIKLDIFEVNLAVVMLSKVFKKYDLYRINQHIETSASKDIINLFVKFEANSLKTKRL